MDAPEDAELLRRYAAEKSETAFAELVRRHLNFVYNAALRRVGGDAHLAEDVTQRVFTALARDAAALAHHPVPAGWLYTTTRNLAAQLVRGERRRRERETKAQLMNEILSATPPAEWERLRPELDEAMDRLTDHDREAVLLRFFAGRSFGEVGARLRLTENAARMRVERALEKMQATLAQRGVTSTAAALAIALAGQTGVAAPAGLATTVTSGALAGASIGAGAGAIFFGIMSTSKIVLGAAALAACLAVGVAWFESNALRATRGELAAAGREREGLQARLNETEGRLALQSRRASVAEEDVDKLLQALTAAQAQARTAVLAAPTASESITHDMVEARYRRAQALARSGQSEEALKEFLWCLDEGMPRVSGYTGVRLSFLLSEIVKLGEAQPAALAALRERRDAAEKQLLASKNDFNAGADFNALNRVLNEEQRSLQLFDQLPPGDPRRRTFGITVFGQLADAQRYKDAAEAVPYSLMSSHFELDRNRVIPPEMPNAARLEKSTREYAVKSTVTNIEVLAGANELEHAKSLAERLLAYDGSDATKTLLQEHLTRAGHPDLLAPPQSGR